MAQVSGDSALHPKQFRALVGNPPYQQSLGGTVNVDVWPGFVEVGAKLGRQAHFIHPARWINPKKAMRPTLQAMLELPLSSVWYFRTCPFPGTAIDAGISITSFREEAPAPVFTIDGKSMADPWDGGFIPLDPLDGALDAAIQEALMREDLPFRSIVHRVKGSVGSAGAVGHGFNKDTHGPLLRVSPEGMERPFRVWANPTKGKGTRYGWYWLEEASLEIEPWARGWKTLISMVGNSTEAGGNIYNGEAYVADGHTLGTGKFSLIPDGDSEADAKLMASLFDSRFGRAILRITQKDLYVRGFERVPDYPLFKALLVRSGRRYVSDAWAFEAFALTPELVAHVERTISKKPAPSFWDEEQDGPW